MSDTSITDTSITVIFHDMSLTVLCDILEVMVSTMFQFFIKVVSFVGGGNLSTGRKLSTCRK